MAVFSGDISAHATFNTDIEIAPHLEAILL